MARGVAAAATTRQSRVFCRQHGWMVRADEAHTPRRRRVKNRFSSGGDGWSAVAGWADGSGGGDDRLVVARRAGGRGGDLCECNAAHAQARPHAHARHGDARARTQTAWH